MSDKPVLSVSENLHLIYCILRALGSAGYGLISFPFLSKQNRASVLFKHVAYSGLRSFTGNSTLRMTRVAALTTDESYAKFAADEGFAPNTVALEDGTKLHWIGNEDSEKIMLFCHGGGYVNYGNLGQMKFLLHNIVKPDSSNISVLFLSYDVAPEHGYPRQLQQAVNALDYVLHTKKRDFKNVILGGDSAGGNLVLGLLSHLSHPHPAIPALKINGKLSAAALLSPWVSFDVETAASMRTNAAKDCLSVPSLSDFMEKFLGSAERDCWNEPSRAPAGWWRDLKVEHVLVIAGADELLVDDIRSFAATLKTFHPATTLFVSELEAHDQPVLDLLFGYTEPGDQAKFFTSWVTAISEGQVVD